MESAFIPGRKRAGSEWFLCACLIFSLLLLFDTETVYAARSGMSYNIKQMVKGESFQLKIKGIKTKSVEWSSSNKKIVSVKNGRITALKAGKATIRAKCGKRICNCRVTVTDKVDLIIFSGQSNMMGHGDAKGAPKLTDGAAYEYKSVTDKKRLNVLKEPFGYKQDSGNLVNGAYCTGSMVTSFCNAYYQKTKTPVVAVAASKVGAGSVAFSTVIYKDIEKRIRQSVKAVRKMGLKIDHCYLVWMQGENDVCAGTLTDEYVERIGGMFRKIVKDTKVEKCMVIKTGSYVYNMGAEELADPKAVLEAQEKICRQYKCAVLISDKAPKLGQEYYQWDMIHLNQEALNLVGRDAGAHAGTYAVSH
ncbi:MAG: hypothetical protein E7294_10655 [Lachnospiraceae bacterium]|jgi:hypothetical protein|nr:hypothetical protein [Lachnospiraceae bacterium]